MEGTDFSEWYNQSEGSFYGFAETSSGADSYMLSAYQDTSNRIAMNWATSDLFFVGVRVGGTFYSGSSTGGTAPTDTFLKAAFAYKIGDNEFALDGSLITSTDHSASISPIRLEIGHYNTACQTNGHIKQLQYYPRRLTNTQLQALST
jgi:hypothetical protein